MDSKKDLIDLLIHDLTAPLAVVTTSVSGLLNRADRHSPLTEHQRRVLDRISRNSRKAQSLLHDMIEIYRAEENLFRTDVFAVREALRESLLEALETLVPQAFENLSSNNQKEVDALLESERIFIQIRGRYLDSPFCHDRRKLQQILRNLISNALKYRREKLKVDVRGDDDLFVSVEDDGCGIPPDQQEEIFKRFSVSKSEKENKVKGMGFGLCGVKLLVETMGGKIQVESAEGRGARFTVRIPSLQGRRRSLLDGKAILAVDDEPDVLSVVEEEIRSASPTCRIDKAHAYGKAVALLESKPYDLVILDIMGVQGFDLLERAAKKNFRVAMLTGHALNPEALKRSFEMRARAYLPKEKLGVIVPFLEDVLTEEYLPGWNKLLQNLDGYFTQTFSTQKGKSSLDYWKEMKERFKVDCRK